MEKVSTFLYIDAGTRNSVAGSATLNQVKIIFAGLPDPAIEIYGLGINIARVNLLFNPSLWPARDEGLLPGSSTSFQKYSHGSPFFRFTMHWFSHLWICVIIYWCVGWMGEKKWKNSIFIQSMVFLFRPYFLPPNAFFF